MLSQELTSLLIGAFNTDVSDVVSFIRDRALRSHHHSILIMGHLSRASRLEEFDEVSSTRQMGLGYKSRKSKVLRNLTLSSQRFNLLKFKA